MKTKNLLLFILLATSSCLKAQDSIKLVPFFVGLKEPLAIQSCGDERMFVALHAGQIFIINAKGKQQRPAFLDIRGRVHAEGLLGFDFDPNYANNGFFYVYYVNKATAGLQLSRFKVSSGDRNIADSNSEKLILEIEPSYNSNHHNGGCVQFGPDGYLYLGIGDGNKQFLNSSQNPHILLGKMLRIDVNHGNPYSIPADNPFVDSSNYKHEIWAMGMRNPWRWSFDAVTGDLWIGDVGEHLWEEVDKQPANSKGGENYGFPCYEGKSIYDTSYGCRAAYTPPVYNYPHDTINAFCNSITGGYVYRGKKSPSLYGKYIFADYCTGTISEFYYNKNGVRIVRAIYKGEPQSYVSFGEDRDHELYVMAYKSKAIYQIAELSQNLVSNKSSNTGLLKIAPTVSKGNFTVTYQSAKTQQVNIHIQNTMGQQFYTATKQLKNGINSWQMNVRLPRGEYFYIITDALHENVSQRLVIE